MNANTDDYVLRITPGGRAFAFIAAVAQISRLASLIHKTPPGAAAAMGQLITAAAMMGFTLKNASDLLTLTVKREAPFGTVTAVTDRNGHVKCEPLPELFAEQGMGMLKITKNLGLREPYTGTVGLVSGKIADGLESYFTLSEQIPAALALDVLTDANGGIKQAGGVLVQALPGDNGGFVSSVRDKLRGFDSARFYDSGKTPYDAAEYLFGGDYTVNEKLPVKYFCNCGRHRMKGVLLSLGKSELTQITEDTGRVNIKCVYCRKEYVFNKEELLF